MHCREEGDASGSGLGLIIIKDACTFAIASSWVAGQMLDRLIDRWIRSKTVQLGSWICRHTAG